MTALFESAIRESRDCSAAFEEALRICRRLNQSGHIAYLAGGCVRDALLHRQPKDFDIATDATPDRVREVFGRNRTLAFGASFGVIGVQPEKGHHSGGLEPTEVATFRSDGEYSDGRRPDKVHFGDAENDALRRDFTINGLFYDPVSEQIIDYVGGQSDLREKRLSTIGKAADRFEEDKLRMLRAVRFATTLNFALCDETFNEIKKRASEITVVSPERVGAEMRRVLVSPNVADGVQLLLDCNLQETVFPDVLPDSIALYRKRVAGEPAQTVPGALALALISLCDHPAQSLEVLSKCWRLSNEEVRLAKFAIDHWMQIAEAHQAAWSQIQPILIHRDISVAIDVADRITRADQLSAEGVALARDAIGWETTKLDPAPILSGESLKKAGLKPGPQFRTWLDQVRRRQLDGEITSFEEAIAFVRSQC